MAPKKEPEATNDTDNANDSVTNTSDVTTASPDQWGEADKATGAKYRSVPHGDQVRVFVLTRTGRSANVLADDEGAGRQALAGFVAEHAPKQ